jgi:hypothetical protein
VAKPTLTGSVPSTDYFRLSQFGIQYVEIDEQFGPYMYPPGTLHPPGRFIVGPAKAAVGDFNGDGFQDLVVDWTAQPHQASRDTEVGPAILLNDGNGNLGVPNANVVGQITNVYMRYRPTVADFNSDGVDDIVFSGSSLRGWNADGSENFLDAPINLLLSQPGGLIADATANIEGQERPLQVPEAYYGGHEISAGDIDGDGDIDLYSGRTLLLNDGTGRFENAHEILPAAATSYDWILISSAMADFDGDGRDELLIGYAEGPTYILSAEGDTEDFVWTVTKLPAGIYGDVTSPNSVVTADINHDGHLDIIFGQTRAEPFYQGRSVQVLINDGSGGFSDQTASRIDNSHRADTYFGEGEIQIVDVDRDGDLDIYDSSDPNGRYLPVDGMSTPGTSVALNDGSGHFTWISADLFVQVQADQMTGGYDWSWAKDVPVGPTFPIDLDGKNGIDYVGSFSNPFIYPQSVPSGATLYSVVSTKPLFRVGDETLGGLSTDDNIAGFDGDDLITGAAGDDLIDGGDGYAVALFSGQRSDYSVWREGNAVMVRDDRTTSPDGTDNLVEIEKLSFADKSYDLLIREKVGSIGPEVLNSLVDLYIAYFNRVPEAGGLDYWIDQYVAGKSLGTIAVEFYTAGIQFSEVTGYSADMPLSDFIKVLYSNVLGRSGSSAPPDADIDYWMDQVATGGATREGMVARFLNDARLFYDDQDVGWVPRLLDQKVEFGKLHAVTYGLDYNDNGTTIETTVALAAAVTPTGYGNAVAMIGLSADDYIA